MYIYICVCVRERERERETTRSTLSFGKRMAAQLVKNLLYIAIFSVKKKLNPITANAISIVQICHY